MKSGLILGIVAISFSWTMAQSYQGFFNFQWNESKGQLLLQVHNPGEEFIYVSGLAAGVGSNDIGLDRGQLGGTHLVRFEKAGDKILLIQSNTQYRAQSDNPEEVRAVKEAFAESVLWGFKIEEKKDGHPVIDMTPFLLRDAHRAAARLKSTKQGSYKVEKDRSAIYLENTHSFPDNSEFEAIITLTGEPEGAEIRSVTPSPDAITVRQHHSFIRLPDEGYTPRKFHPFSGYFPLMFYDYALPIGEPIQLKYIRRHRLIKKDPSAQISDPVKPIVYYIDPGCPEPIKSALMDGAAWWKDAFEYAGFSNAFEVRELPADAHPLDVRYNMIQWIHRSTRGWSYGASITDPRTGEIIKGHVSLGSLRVRQDFMIAQGIFSPFIGDNEDDAVLIEVALARLRQLSAHEIGHTIGLAHNFASSVNDRASVMDYPHPYFEWKEDGTIDYSNAYDSGIGIWDKRAILYGYAEFPEGSVEEEGLLDIIRETRSMGLYYLSDADARPEGSLHPQNHLWDNGVSATEELKRLIHLRSVALERFGANTIRKGTPYSELEKLLVPVFLMHRYQAEAVSKIYGGKFYSFSVKGDSEGVDMNNVPIEMQKEALDALLLTLQPSFLKIPDHIIAMIPPSAPGFGRDRETFKGFTGLAFDPLAPGHSYAESLFQWMLNEERLSRIYREDHARLPGYFSTIEKNLFTQYPADATEFQIFMNNQKLYIHRLIHLALHAKDQQVAALAAYRLETLKEDHLTQERGAEEWIAHLRYLRNTWERALKEPGQWKLPAPQPMPPGAPIGCGFSPEILD
ncbi:MAG TPA: zinc-dependent metalloprotease [Saprospiraceae bacterium]|nr:zinc-dependent metalloprotease [Saprospiraceae bacterium]